jgi:transcriptional regulator NrdR family protein
MAGKSTPGLACPECGSPTSEVVDSRSADGFIRRRRECQRGHRFTTHEYLAPEYATGVIKANDVAKALADLLRHATPPAS